MGSFTDNSRIVISKGPSFRYFYVGLFIIIFTVIIIFSENYIAGIFLPVGLSLFLSVYGNIINIQERKIKPYFNFVLLKLGEWQSLDNFRMIALKYTNESQVMASRGTVNSYSTKSYNIILIDQSDETIQLNEFTEYAYAREFLDEYAKILNLEKFDEVEAIRESVAARR